VQRAAFETARYGGEFKLHSPGLAAEQGAGGEEADGRLGNSGRAPVFRQEMNMGFLRRDSNGFCYSQRHLIENTEVLKFDLRKDYKQEYMRVYLANMMIMDRIQRYQKENETIQSNILNLKVLLC
jgi:hypothetical protein